MHKRGRHKKRCTCPKCTARRHAPKAETVSAAPQGFEGTVSAQTEPSVDFNNVSVETASDSTVASPVNFQYVNVSPSQEEILAEKLRVPSHLKQQIKAKAKNGKSVVGEGDMRSEMDQTLDHFKYTLDPNEVAMWRQNETLSPMHVPQALKKNYPELAWRWVSNRTLSEKGQGYNGFELFRDKDHVNGIKRGPDMQLAVMPKELAEERKRVLENRSSELVDNLAPGYIDRLERAMVESGGKVQPLSENDLVRKTVVTEGMLEVETEGKPVTGVRVGARAAIGRQGALPGRPSRRRGLSEEQRAYAEENIAKLREKPNRTIFT